MLAIHEIKQQGHAEFHTNRAVNSWMQEIALNLPSTHLFSNEILTEKIIIKPLRFTQFPENSDTVFN